MGRLRELDLPPSGLSGERNFALPFAGYLDKWSITLGRLRPRVVGLVARFDLARW